MAAHENGQNDSGSQARMSSSTHLLQHFSRKDNVMEEHDGKVSIGGSTFTGLPMTLMLLLKKSKN